MRQSVVDRILEVVPPAGLAIKVKTVRGKLKDIADGPLDYALQGLLATGRLKLLNAHLMREIVPLTMQDITEKQPAQHRLARAAGRPKQHPWRQLPAVSREQVR